MAHRHYWINNPTIYQDGVRLFVHRWCADCERQEWSELKFRKDKHPTEYPHRAELRKPDNE